MTQITETTAHEHEQEHVDAYKAFATQDCKQPCVEDSKSFQTLRKAEAICGWK